MEILEDIGFFHEDYEKFRRTISASEVNKFSLLENDEQRALFVHEIIEDRFGGKLWTPVRGTDNGKDFARALEKKVLGNKEFQCKKWQDALQCYNDACLLLPSENGKRCVMNGGCLTLGFIQAIFWHRIVLFLARANVCIPQFCFESFLMANSCSGSF